MIWLRLLLWSLLEAYYERALASLQDRGLYAHPDWREVFWRHNKYKAKRRACEAIINHRMKRSG